MHTRRTIRYVAIFLSATCAVLAICSPQWAAELVVQGRYWNLWARPADGESVVTHLDLNNRYTFSLDLSRIPYVLERPVHVDPGLDRKLQESSYKTATLVIRPTFIDDALSLAEPPSSQRMEIEIDQLKSAPKDELRANELLRDPSKLTLTLAKSVRAGFYEINLIPKRSGCASIALSIWNDAGIYPLDHVIATFYISDNNDIRAQNCTNGKSELALGGGLTTMLDVANSFNGGDPPIDGALYIFDDAWIKIPGKQANAMAMYVDRSQISNAKAKDRRDNKGVYAWQLLRSADRILSDNFIAGIINARANATDRYRQNNPYSDVAKELEQMVFPPGIQEAQDALSALKDTVRSAKQAARILVRLTSFGTPSGYLPLGLLAARSETPILDRSIVVVQPLPRPSYSHANTCVESWIFGVPDELEKADKYFPADIDKPQILMGQTSVAGA